MVKFSCKKYLKCNSKVKDEKSSSAVHHTVLSSFEGDCIYLDEMSHGNNSKRVIVFHSVYIPSTDLALTFFGKTVI